MGEQEYWWRVDRTTGAVTRHPATRCGLYTIATTDSGLPWRINSQVAQWFDDPAAAKRFSELAPDARRHGEPERKLADAIEGIRAIAAERDNSESEEEQLLDRVKHDPDLFENTPEADIAFEFGESANRSEHAFFSYSTEVSQFRFDVSLQATKAEKLIAFLKELMR